MRLCYTPLVYCCNTGVSTRCTRIKSRRCCARPARNKRKSTWARSVRHRAACSHRVSTYHSELTLLFQRKLRPMPRRVSGFQSPIRSLGRHPVGLGSLNEMSVPVHRVGACAHVNQRVARMHRKTHSDAASEPRVHLMMIMFTTISAGD